jgi:hypothetical protein
VNLQTSTGLYKYAALEHGMMGASSGGLLPSSHEHMVNLRRRLQAANDAKRCRRFGLSSDQLIIS